MEIDINKILENEIKEEIHHFLNRYKNKDYLSSDEAAKELGVGTGDNLRKQIEKYKGLYLKEGTDSKPRYRWVKFLIAKHIYTLKLRELN